MPTTMLLRSADIPAATPNPGAGDAGPPPALPDGGGDGRPEGIPMTVAIVVIVLIAALLTFVGMQTQIWANIAGSQLPGA